MTVYGYARVSSVSQDYAAQVAQLTAAGCERIFSEKASAAAGRKRPALHQAVAQLGAGDVLIVVRLNRLARSARDALNTLETVRAKGADFRSLHEAWADTTTPTGRLAVTIMSAFAEFDREAIVERTTEGRRSAKARGVKLGRKNTLTTRQRAFVRDQRALQHPPSISELAGLLGTSKRTIDRAIREGLDPPAAPIGWHAPGCAMHTSGAGNPVRCTCGGRDGQIDLEFMAGVTP